MYKSPLTVLEHFIDDIMAQREDKIVAIVQSKIDVDVDKDELIRALQYDRNQYNAGYKDGKADAMRWIPVSEIRPEAGKNVLAVCWWHETWSVRVCYLSVNNPGCWYTSVAGQWTPEVTHWMPLPKLPEVTE